MNSTKRPLLCNEETLVKQAVNGDLYAFNQLVLHYQDGLYRYAMLLVRDPDLADDIIQESFIKAFQNIKSLQGVSFRPWLFKIAINTIRDIARRNARHPLLPLHAKDENGEEIESSEWLIDPNAMVEDTVQSNDTSAFVYKMLDELPEAYRSILTLIDLQDMDYTEAARILQVPLGTVKSRLARARLQMKLKLQSRQDGYVASNSLQALTI